MMSESAPAVGEGAAAAAQHAGLDQDQRRIFINAFEMFTPNHLSFGQWRREEDRSSTKRRDLSYWTNLAQTLERGNVTALVIADTFGQHDVYKGSAEPTVRTAVQYPMGDPAVVSSVLSHCKTFMLS